MDGKGDQSYLKPTVYNRGNTCKVSDGPLLCRQNTLVALLGVVWLDLGRQEISFKL